jgi:hypothetical protein
VIGMSDDLQADPPPHPRDVALAGIAGLVSSGFEVTEVVLRIESARARSGAVIG